MASNYCPLAGDTITNLRRLEFLVAKRVIVITLLWLMPNSVKSQDAEEFFNTAMNV
ncbi:MAG TPA: hypothetical protein VF141_05885 [Chryseolinea sp.]